MNKTKKQEENVSQKDESKSEILQRLAQASVEGLAIEVAMNAIIPGGGVALQGLNQGKNIKKAAKVMGKSAGKEGIKMLDEEENESPVEELSEDIALEMLTRVGGRE